MSDTKLDELLTGPAYQLWVEGTRIVRPWDDESRSNADKLSDAATALGLHVFRQPVAESEDPETAPRRRRWTHRRVGIDEVRRHVESRPGIRFVDLLEDIYFEPPWSDLKKNQAAGKLRTSLARLRQSGHLVKRYDSAGVERWQPANLATGLLPTPAGPAAPRMEESHLPPAPLLADQLTAGEKMLKQFSIFPEEALSADPNLYLDLVKELYRTLTDQETLHGPSRA